DAHKKIKATLIYDGGARPSSTTTSRSLIQETGKNGGAGTSQSANVERCRFLAEASPSTVTPLNKLIGYEAAAKIAKYSVANKVTVRDAVVALGYVERGEVTEAQLDEALDVTKMLGDF
ncbi:MAG: hypothetical protein ACFNL3_00995, partial [Rothia aeria]